MGERSPLIGDSLSRFYFVMVERAPEQAREATTVVVYTEKDLKR